MHRPEQVIFFYLSYFLATNRDLGSSLGRNRAGKNDTAATGVFPHMCICMKRGLARRSRSRAAGLTSCLLCLP